MTREDDTDETVSRRSVLGGIGGAGVASLSGLPAVTAEGSTGLEDLETDPHTRDTFRAVVNAIIPATPALVDELGPEHEPGGLAVDLERFLIWNYNNAEEMRAEGLSRQVSRALSMDRGEDDLATIVDDVRSDHSQSTRDRLDRLGLTDVDAVFGALRRIGIGVGYTGAETGPVTVGYAIETAETSVTDHSVNYPYAPVFAACFDVIALEFVAQDRHEDDVDPDSAFAAGGAFSWLSRRDRLRCFGWLSEGTPIAVREAELSELVAAPEALPGVVMTTHILTALGYYSEWAGYGETKTAPPSQRALETPVDRVQGRRQTGYPGPAPGYAGYRGFEVSEFRENDY